MRKLHLFDAVRRGLRSLPAAIVGLMVAAVTAVAIAAAPLGEVEQGMGLGLNFYGGDIAKIALPAPDPGLCRAACDRDGQCRGWTFVKPGTLEASAVCFLKNQIGQPSRDDNAISAGKGGTTYTMAQGARIENWMGMGFDLPGGDIENTLLDRGDPSLCAARCEANNACRSWTFMKPGVWNAKAICWLKGSVPNAVINNNTISGRRQSPVAFPPAATTDWGVWATAVGGIWGDPCAIQYVARVIDGNRYDADTRNYRRVRARANQRDADLDLNAFSRFFQDKPDGIVKLTPCGGGVGGGGGPAVSGAIPPPGTGFGVWAYVIGVADRSDPCSWQYVAAAIPGNRYDSDTSYRRVRARFTMEDASNDVTFFSAFMQDQPDGIAKLRPCSAATQLLPPRPGGPGVVPVKWGVWAYTIGVATFDDPCAIQYVKAAIPKYDGVSRYVRVAETNSESEASNLVTRFSAFMQDQPDGVVKLRPCSETKKDGGGSDYAAWMTGVFDGGFGVTTFSPGGGSYTISNGTLAATGVKGATMEGIWRQSVSGGQCADKGYWGKFKITFTADGFSGLWGYCENEPNMGWTGTRKR